MLAVEIAKSKPVFSGRMRIIRNSLFVEVTYKHQRSWVPFEELEFQEQEKIRKIVLDCLK